MLKRLRASGPDWRRNLCLAALAFVLYLPGIMWGLPDTTGRVRVSPWGHDDVMPLGPLAEFHNVFVEAKPDRFLGYPLMQYMVVFTAYAPYLAYLFLSGGLSEPSGLFPFGLEDPDRSLVVLTIIARSISLLMAVGTVVAAGRVGRILGNSVGGWLAGAFVMTLYPMFYYAHRGNLDVPYMFWATLALVVYCSILKGAFTVKRGIWLGTFAALSIGTKDQSAAFFLLMPLLLLPLHWWRARNGEKGSGTLSASWRAPAATAVAGLAVYAAASGFMLSPERYIAHVAHILGVGDTPIRLPSYPATLEGYRLLLQETWQALRITMGDPLIAAALVGIPIAITRFRLTLGLFVPAAGVLALFIVPTLFVEIRYVLPIGVVLACFAAVALCAGIRSPYVVARAVSFTWVAVILLTSLASGVGLIHSLWYDSRYVAAEWLNAHAGRGETIGFFGPSERMPRVRDDIQFEILTEFRGTRPTRYTEDQLDNMARHIQEQALAFVLVIPDRSVQPGLPYGVSCPPEVVSRLQDGSLGYTLVSRFETEPLSQWMEPRPLAAYSVVNPEVQIFKRTGAR